MPNLRIIYDNAADRAALTASSEVGDLTVDNLKTDTKTRMWRAAGRAATLTAVWAAPELVGGVVLPFSNLSPEARMRVRGYAEASGGEAIVDTGWGLACGPAPLGLFDWGGVPLGLNAAAYGGYAYAMTWFEIRAVRRLVIELDDEHNAAPYIEASRLIAGTYWEPRHNAEWSPELVAEDQSTHTETDAGDTQTRVGPRKRSLSLSLAWMPTEDRNRLMDILRAGIGRPFFLSLFPEDADPTREQQYAIYGKRPDARASLVYEFIESWRHQLTIKEV